MHRGRLVGGSIFRVLSSELNAADPGVKIDAVQFGTARGLNEERQRITHENTSVTGLCHEPWTVSAARFAPGELYGSFFVCLQEEPSLNYGGARHPDGEGFAPFGRVVEGRGVILRAHDLAEAGGLLSRPVPLLAVSVVDPAAAAGPG
ncbi:MAG: hypothetical protein ACX93N_00845 [Pseudohaliea sp.]